MGFSPVTGDCGRPRARPRLPTESSPRLALVPACYYFFAVAPRQYFWQSRGNRYPLGSPMRRYLPYLIVAFVALATFGSGFALYRAKLAALPADAKGGPASGIHVRGKAGALVTIEEFGDFQCPPCSIMSAVLAKLEEEYGARLRVIFHHFPLAIHAHAREAALAAEAAGMQGRFWEMHDLLYKEQAVWSKAPDVPSLFQSYAGTIKLDLDRFKERPRRSGSRRPRRCRSETGRVARGHQHADLVRERCPVARGGH